MSDNEWDESAAVFSEDSSADEETLKFKYTKEGVEIEYDCLGCEASSPLTFTWPEIVELHEGRPVKDVRSTQTMHSYSHRCPHCYRSYVEKGYDPQAAAQSAVKTISITVQEVAGWYSQAVRRLKKAAVNRPAPPQRRQRQVQNPAPQQPVPRPQAPQPPPQAPITMQHVQAIISRVVPPPPGKVKRVPVAPGRNVYIDHLGRLVKLRRMR